MGLSSERRHRLVSVPATKQKRNFDRSLPKSQVSSTEKPVHPQREGLSPDSPTPAGKVPACFAQRMSAGRCRPDPCWGSTQDHEIRSEAACTQSVESVREKGFAPFHRNNVLLHLCLKRKRRESRLDSSPSCPASISNSKELMEMTAEAPCALALQPPMLSLLYSPLASLPFIPLLFLWYSRMVCPFGLHNCIRPTFLVAHPCQKTAPLWRPLPRFLTTQLSCPSSSSQVVHVITLPGLAPPSHVHGVPFTLRTVQATCSRNSRPSP